MIPKKARKKPVVIEYMPWPGGPTLASEVINWALSQGGTIRWHDEVTELRAPNGELARLYQPEHLSINTLEGTMTASIGDVIIRGVQGEFYACKPDVFAQTYEDVTE